MARQLGLLILLILLKVLVKLLSDKTSREEFGSDISIERRSTGVLFGHNKMDWLQNLMSPNGVGVIKKKKTTPNGGLIGEGGEGALTARRGLIEINKQPD